MSYLVVSVAALVVAALTLFSGFGLGTLLMPVFAVFFPVETAVAATAVVHLANNVFKLTLFGKWADWSLVVRFALPAAALAVVGALLLGTVVEMQPLLEYTLVGWRCEVTVVKLLIALLIGAFTLFELHPRFAQLNFNRKWLPLGGALSGFFGGLSGHQGALRSAFLIRAGLEKKVFLGTLVVCAVAVDVSRLAVYGTSKFSGKFTVFQDSAAARLVLVAILAAFVGTFVGSRLVEKISMQTVHKIVAVMLLLLAAGLATGLVGAQRTRSKATTSGERRAGDASFDLHLERSV